ncbi:MAG: phosphate/phosphite/phosphonate ABC transporter substrate-binding protein [Candidatus Magnetoovum sp. WYHC-5]|nr:phosphate/phosphite/phosphonate ABC transporter substrate-binding protein [Candidatus Magnetoovum sp. WYHC-5]
MAETLVFGVVPQQSPIKIYQLWQPLIDFIKKELGISISLKTEKSIEAFQDALYAQEYDIAYVNPYDYVFANKRCGYTSLVRGNKTIVGILVARKDSSIDSINDVEGKVFLFPSKTAFAATVLIKYELLKKYNYNVDRATNTIYVNSHDSVYKGIARGIGDVGGGIERTFDSLSDVASKSMLKIIYHTDAYISHAIAVHPRVSPKIKEKLKAVLLNTPQNILNPLDIGVIITAEDNEYDIIRQLINDMEHSGHIIP